MSARHCTVCNRPAKGHIGPMGSNCQNEPSENSETEASMSSLNHDTESSGSKASELLLRELITQMSGMNTNFERMNFNQERIMVKLEQTMSDNHASEAAARPRNNDDQQYVSRHDKHITQAQNGEFVNLCDFLPNIHYTSGEMEPIVENGSLQFRSKRTRKVIDSFTMWSKAWNGYERAIMAKYPDMYEKLVGYRELIQTCDTKYQWHAVSTYDMRFRHDIGKCKSFAFDTMDTTLFSTILDATAVKVSAKTCLRCRSYDHFVSNCPFPAEASGSRSSSDNTITAQSQDKRRSPQPVWYHEGREGCNNFQSASCFYSGCKRAHVCKKCKGPDPFSKCKQCA